MNIFINPPRQEWETLLKRPYVDNNTVQDAVRMILNGVKQHGDEAVRAFVKKFDGVNLDRFEVDHEEINRAEKELPEDLRSAILQAKDNIEAFHKVQLAEMEIVETMPGVQCWRKSVGIERVGLYIPGGTAPLFSTVLMLAIPAKLAGCRDVVLCTPCHTDGTVNAAILFAAQTVGITKIYKIGGAQAIAAMAYGTESVPRVFKIFGPGNQYVTAAKQLVQMEGTAIDMPAGPSEVCVMADDTADPRFVAADLLSQAEHGSDSQVLLVGSSEDVVRRSLQELKTQLTSLPRREKAEKALEHSKALVIENREEALLLINEYAPEHLIICCHNAEQLADKVINAGSVFIGNYSPESVGDYASGTNHTLPTNGFARAYSGVSIDSFVKKITYQKLTKEGLKSIAATVTRMAEAEGLQAHAHAVTIRLSE